MARRGTHLKIDIRIALNSLGHDPFDPSVNRMTIAQLERFLLELRAEQKKVGGILKEAV